MARRATFRFIEPQSRHGRPFNAWISRWPLLGPVTLATILEQRGYDATVYSENISGPLFENDAALADIARADVVGISIMTPTAARGYVIADGLRQRGLPARIVFGGVHATFCPDEALRHGDIVVRGEGEGVIEAIASGEIRQGIVQGAPVADLDMLPALNHFLLRGFEKLSRRSLWRKAYELPVMTSRGCPYACEYCTVTRMFGRRVRRQSVNKVMADIGRYADRGFRHLFFYDDNLTTDADWTRELCTRLAPMGLRFNAQVRADFHWQDRARRARDDALLGGMRNAGGDVLYVGYETVDDATARQWRKGYGGRGSLAGRLLEDTRILHEHGFWIHGMFVLGPQHTQQMAEEIVSFARQAAIETLQISILTPFPGTPLLEQMRPHLVFADFPADWDFYDGTHCVYAHARLGIEGLQRAVLEAHRSFYRWGGLSLCRLRAFAGQRSLSFAQKLGSLWSSARTARTTLRSWTEEMRAFIEIVKARAPQLRLE